MDKIKVNAQMDGVIEIFKNDAGTIRTGRANPALIEGIQVTAYEGQPRLKLIELGTIAVEGARSLTFQPWDRSIINNIKNGIMQSGTNLTPILESDKIRINLPALTVEQREDYVKLLHKKAEAARVMIREARSDFRRQLQHQLQEKVIGEDDCRHDEEELQKITDDYIGRIDEMVKVKEAEIRE